MTQDSETTLADKVTGIQPPVTVLLNNRHACRYCKGTGREQSNSTLHAHSVPCMACDSTGRAGGIYK